MFDDDDDFLDDMFEYDMVMNDGKWFFGGGRDDDMDDGLGDDSVLDDFDRGRTRGSYMPRRRSEPSGCGCLLVCIAAFVIICALFFGS